MENNSKITITSKITIGAENDEMTFSAPCFYTIKNNTKYIFYTETNFDSNATTKCRITINEDLIEIRKTGEIITSMVFSTTKENKCKYYTPFGANNFTIQTEKLLVTVKDNIDTINLIYKLYNQNEHIGKYNLTIKLYK